MNKRMVLDSSALLAIVFGEPGEDRAARIVASALVSTVNLSEAAAKMNERGFAPEQTTILLGSLGFDTAPFEEADAYDAGKLRTTTMAAGLSFGDRACLALALREGGGVLTADRAWAQLDIGVEIEMIR